MFSEYYEKKQLLGQGAYGCAYLVAPRKSPRLRQVAKEIRISHLSEKQREGALAESEVLKMMKHSNIVAHIDSFMEGPHLYIIMEYADGGDLAAKIKERKGEGKVEVKPFEEREVVFVFVQLALALRHIHSRKVLHRDLKPLNVFLTKQGVVKLGDFGIARMLDSTTSGAQTTIGTPSYLSPEMCNNEAYGIKADLWSLGVVTYELIALRVPFHGTSLPVIIMQIIGAQPDPLPKGFSKDLSWLVFGFLEKEPTQRPELEKVLLLPFVQRYIQVLLSHTMESGSGGCEAIAAGASRRASSPASRQPPPAAPPAAERAARAESFVSSAAAAEAAPGDGGQYAAPAPGPRAAAAGGGPARPPGREQPLRRAQSVSSAAAEVLQGKHEAIEREYLLNKQAAAETKRRAEMPQVPQHRDQGPAKRFFEDDEPADSERRIQEVRRRAQQEKEEQAAVRARELQRASREAQEDRRMLHQKMCALQSEGDHPDVPASVERQVPESHGQEEVVREDVQVYGGRPAAPQDGGAGALSAREYVQDEEQVRRVQQHHAEAESPCLQGDSREDGDCYSGRGNAGADTDRSRQGAERDAVEQIGAIIIPFTDKVRPKPKLSSEGRTRSRAPADMDGDAAEQKSEMVIPFTDKVRPKPKLSSDAGPRRRATPVGDPDGEALERNAEGVVPFTDRRRVKPKLSSESGPRRQAARGGGAARCAAAGLGRDAGALDAAGARRRLAAARRAVEGAVRCARPRRARGRRGRAPGGEGAGGTPCAPDGSDLRHFASDGGQCGANGCWSGAKRRRRAVRALGSGGLL